MRKYLYLTLLNILPFALPGCAVKSQPKPPDVFLGADLSYVNELEDCGGSYRVNREKADPYRLFAKEGANIVRLRLWHTPDWTSYSTLRDVKKSIRRAKDVQMQVLLDFHYSDTWADPAHQIIPEVWKGIGDVETLGDSLYQYTLGVLNDLHRDGLTPEFVQIGNEINSEILMEKPTAENGPTNWPRNTLLLNRGLEAVKDFNQTNNEQIKTMLHVAQPENAREWFKQAFENKLGEFDLIGLSYYPNWSEYNLTQLTETIAFLRTSYNKEVWVVEAGYPYTLKNFDQADNVLGQGSNLDGYPVSPEGQLSFMIDLTNAVINGGGKGVIYWEAAWISTSCKTRWGTGSHWENAAFFDAERLNEALPVFQFLHHTYLKQD